MNETDLLITSDAGCAASPNTIEQLSAIFESGKISQTEVLALLEQMGRKEILREHEKNYKIYPVTVRGKTRWETKLPGKKSPIRYVNRKDLEKAIVEHYKLGKESLNKIYEDFIAGKILDGKSNARKLQWVFDKYFRDTAFAQKNIKYITVNDIKNFFRETCTRYGLNARQAKEMKTLLNAIYDYACDEDIVQINRSRQLRNLCKDKDYLTPTYEKSIEEEVFSVEEIVNLCNICAERYEQTGNTMYLGILLNFQLGLRAGELCALKFDDFDENFLTLTRSEVPINEVDEKGIVHRNGFQVVPYLKKHATQRRIPLTHNAKVIVSFLKQANASMGFPQCEWLFIDANGDRHHSTHINRPLELACKQAGIPKRSNHKIRKTFISDLLMYRTIGLTDVRDIAGHKDAQMTLKIYAKTVAPSTETVKKMEQVLPDLPELKLVKSGQVI